MGKHISYSFPDKSNQIWTCKGTQIPHYHQRLLYFRGMLNIYFFFHAIWFYRMFESLNKILFTANQLLEFNLFVEAFYYPIFLLMSFKNTILLFNQNKKCVHLEQEMTMKVTIRFVITQLAYAQLLHVSLQNDFS